jgi:hypothetical protein
MNGETAPEGIDSDSAGIFGGRNIAPKEMAFPL